MLTACRGLGIDIDDARELASMIPMVRGKVYSIDECINGCEDNGYVPVSGFESKVLSYPNLLETVKEIEGLVSGRGVHASGLYIFSQPFVEQNALMKAPNGTWTTCWNMSNSDQCGALKIDCLTVESLDRLHKCIDLLIEDGLIEDKGGIRENYNEYLSPDVLDYDSPAMWDAAGNDEICDLFQMATTVGREAMVKIKPRSLKQVSISSSVMRLMGNEDMVPIDRYASFIQDISLWYQEMKDAGLNEDEVKVLEKHLLSNNGASIEQEDLMTLLMDEKISGFDIVWSNKARKGLAKRDRNLIEQVSKKYYEDGEKLGTRKQMLDYVWKYCLKPQLGYSFSRLHSIGYAHITLQEMNLYHRYPHIYWQTACLTINASANEDVEDGKSTNYGKVASAISNMQLNGVKIALPLINQAKFGFSPDRENNQIIFGLKGLNGVGDDAVRLIVAKRPYASFDDFLKKTSGSIDTKCIINLIKAGCFDELEPSMSRERLMNVYAYHLGYSKAGLKESLNMQNFPSIAELDIVPPAFDFEKRLYYFKKYVFSKHNEVEKNVYLMDTEAKAFFDAELYRSFKEGEHYIISENGDYALLKKSFDKYYKSAVNRLVEWVTNPSTVAVYNESALENYANNLHSKYCEGNKSKWEMDSLSFYHSKHELADLDEDSYGISSWDSIPEEPAVESIEEKVNKKGEVSQFVKYRLYKIAGTVLDKNANGHSITLLTPNGVATVKFYDGAFTHYSKQVSVIDPDSGKKKVIEKSWFDRGTKLLITGIRRGDTFFPKRYFDSVYQHTVCKIENVSEDGKYMELKYDRERSE